MMTTHRWLIVALLLAGLLSASLNAQSSSSISPLLKMMAAVPLEAATTQSGWAIVRYADYAAAFEADGVSFLRALGDVDLLLESIPIAHTLGRLVAGPEATNYLLYSAGNMKELVGFEWWLDVDQSLEFGDPPDLGLLLSGDFDPTAIGTALEARAFERSEIEGVPVWWRFDDFAISIADRDVNDPFGGHLGAAARIALLPDGLAQARSWPRIESMIAADQGIQPSLADDPAYRGLAEAISSNEGWLLQALFFDGSSLRADATLGSQPSSLLGTLPDYSVAVFADRQEGDDQVHWIGLACANRAAAQTASEVLAQRIDAFAFSNRPDEALVERYGAVVRLWVKETPSYGGAFAFIEARYPLPPLTAAESSQPPDIPAPLFRAWVRAILWREFTPLW